MGWWIFLAVVLEIGVACAWGFGTRAVIYNKGYNENWFWWGFFFGAIALIVAATKPTVYSDNRYSYSSPNSYSGQSTALSRLAAATKAETAARNGMPPPRMSGWWCPKCRKENPDYLTTCECGLSLKELTQFKKEEEERAKEKENKALELQEKETESKNLDILKKYKELLDSGIITQEDFDAKKKQLLGL